MLTLFMLCNSMISRLHVEFVSYEYVCGEMGINPAYAIQHLPILFEFRSDYHGTLEMKGMNQSVYKSIRSIRKCLLHFQSCC